MEILRRALGSLLLVWFVTGTGAARAEDALAYLEGLKGKPQPYLAPSEIDPRYTIALYVNAAGKGPNKQRMWVLHRDGIGGAWRLAMWDKAYWAKAKLGDGEVPAYSWPVSTGRYYPGDRKSGPTPTGIYALDERKRRYGRGWMQDGMIHVMHIDLHYSDGRMSGVAFHGTTPGRYRRLGSIDSHGCVRMHQRNALALLDRVTGKDSVLSEELRWGEVPRYWQIEKGNRRYGYTRNGVSPAPVPQVPEAAAASAAIAAPPTTPPETAPAELTKTGFRAIAVIFQD
jgi:hypothetical protein